MRLYDIFQYAVIGALVPVSALYVLRRQAPASYRRGRVALALWLLKPRRPEMFKRWGRRLAPPRQDASACGSCGTGCAPR